MRCHLLGLVWLLLLFLLMATALANLNVVTREEAPPSAVPSAGAAVDEVIVESSLRITKPKANARKTRSLAYDSTAAQAQPAGIADNNISLLEHKRVKRTSVRVAGKLASLLLR